MNSLIIKYDEQILPCIYSCLWQESRKPHTLWMCYNIVPFLQDKHKSANQKFLKKICCLCVIQFWVMRLIWFQVIFPIYYTNAYLILQNHKPWSKFILRRGNPVYVVNFPFIIHKFMSKISDDLRHQAIRATHF